MAFSEEHLRFILGFKLKNLRLEHGLSLKEASRKAGLSISYLSEIEKGKKYPKAEKLLALARSYGISFDELVMVEGQDNVSPLEDSLDSGFFQEFPFHLFGLHAEDLFSLLTTSPEKADALVRTFLEIGQMYDFRVEHILFAALRAHQKMHHSYFPDLEEAVETFSSGPSWKNQEISEVNLRRFLEKKWRYIIDDKFLTQHPTLHSFRSVFIPGKRPRLFVNRRLLPSQKAFIFAKEIGTRVLGIETRATTSSWIKVKSFEQVLNNYRTSYFAGAFLMNRSDLSSGLRRLFRRSSWNPSEMLELMRSFDATPEMFFYRIGQLAHAHFGLSSHYFMRLSHLGGRSQFEVTKMLNLTTLSLPLGYSSNEHYCRKWAGMRLLGERSRQREIAYPDLPARTGPTIQAQRARFSSGGEHVFSFSMSRTMQLSPEDDSSVILGFPIDENFRSAVSFWNDDQISEDVVGITCERCPLGPDECDVRMAEPLQLRKETDISRFEQSLQELEDQFSDRT